MLHPAAAMQGSLRLLSFLQRPARKGRAGWRHSCDACWLAPLPPPCLTLRGTWHAQSWSMAACDPRAGGVHACICTAAGASPRCMSLGGAAGGSRACKAKHDRPEKQWGFRARWSMFSSSSKGSMAAPAIQGECLEPSAQRRLSTKPLLVVSPQPQQHLI